MTRSAEKLPGYLKRYVTRQDYERYSPRDHAAWRFIMRQNREYFRGHAVPIYLQGLEKTGIPIDRIPRIEEMDAKLQKLGWGAVAIEGFIPSAAFLEFQARGILPIAVDMRTVEHIGYTPAPDIVHEAAGHAPIIADPDYAAYLRQYASMAQKAIISREDIELYEAIRYLSDVKENPDVPKEEIARAEERFKRVAASVSYVSEATQMARMAWWTVEYGLVGERNPRIYGAGLLSSVGESQHCLSDKVRKIPLSVECVEYSYNITEPQPQLFVAKDLKQLTAVLKEFESTMAFVRGGVESAAKALRAETVNTLAFDSGIEASGVLVEYESLKEDIEFVRFAGPVQLARNGTQLRGHGRERHGEGFSSPMGRWLEYPMTDAWNLSDADLERIGIVPGRRATLKYVSGYEVTGVVKSVTREAGRLMIVTWTDCTVRRGSKTRFEPSWGEFDLIVGDRLVSVYTGPADREAYGEFEMGQASSKPGRTSPYTAEELSLFELYRRTRAIRESGRKAEDEMREIAATLSARFPSEWLLGVELVELAHQRLGRAPGEIAWMRPLAERLSTGEGYPEDIRWIIRKGLDVAHVSD